MGFGVKVWSDPCPSAWTNAHRGQDRHPTLSGSPDPHGGVEGVGGDGGNGAPNVSEFWKVVGGLQLLAARDGQSAGHGAGGDTDLSAVLGSGNAKEGSEPGGDLAVGEGRRGGWVREAYN